MPVADCMSTARDVTGASAPRACAGTGPWRRRWRRCSRCLLPTRSPVVLNEVPLDALVARLGTNRNAVYKAVFDARRKIRGFLVANGYLEDRRRGPS